MGKKNQPTEIQQKAQEKIERIKMMLVANIELSEKEIHDNKEMLYDGKMKEGLAAFRKTVDRLNKAIDLAEKDFPKLKQTDLFKSEQENPRPKIEQGECFRLLFEYMDQKESFIHPQKWDDFIDWLDVRNIEITKEEFKEAIIN